MDHLHANKLIPRV